MHIHTSYSQKTSLFQAFSWSGQVKLQLVWENFEERLGYTSTCLIPLSFFFNPACSFIPSQQTESLERASTKLTKIKRGHSIMVGLWEILKQEPVNMSIHVYVANFSSSFFFLTKNVCIHYFASMPTP